MSKLMTINELVIGKVYTCEFDFSPGAYNRVVFIFDGKEEREGNKGFSCKTSKFVNARKQAINRKDNVCTYYENQKVFREPTEEELDFFSQCFPDVKLNNEIYYEIF